jgi:hypothetical protein
MAARFHGRRETENSGVERQCRGERTATVLAAAREVGFDLGFLGGLEGAQGVELEHFL